MLPASEERKTWRVISFPLRKSSQVTVHYGSRRDHLWSELSWPKLHSDVQHLLHWAYPAERAGVSGTACCCRYTRIWPMTKVCQERCTGIWMICLRKTDGQCISFKGKPGKINLFLGLILLQLRSFNILMILDASFASKLSYKPVCFAASSPVPHQLLSW